MDTSKYLSIIPLKPKSCVIPLDNGIFAANGPYRSRVGQRTLVQLCYLHAACRSELRLLGFFLFGLEVKGDRPRAFAGHRTGEDAPDQYEPHLTVHQLNGITLRN